MVEVIGNDVAVVDSSSNLRLFVTLSMLGVIVMDAVTIDSVIDATSSDTVFVVVVVVCLKSFVLDIRLISMSIVSVALDVLSNIVFVMSFVLVLLGFSAPGKCSNG